MEEQLYLELKEKITKVIQAQNTCEEGERDLLSVEDVANLCVVLKKYWFESLDKYKEFTFDLFDTLYQPNKETFNDYGLWYNENTDSGKAIVNRGTGIVVSGNAKVYVYNEAEVKAIDSSMVFAFDNSSIIASGFSRITLADQAKALSESRAKVTGNGYSTIFANGPTHITACEDTTVYAKKWIDITAVGNSKVYAHKNIKIKLFGNAELNLTPLQEIEEKFC